jgi:hypothetical protein
MTGMDRVWSYDRAPFDLSSQRWSRVDGATLHAGISALRRLLCGGSVC